MHALIRRVAWARKETCQMLNHMGWEGAHCATHKKTRACNFNACVLFACRFSMAAWLWINDLLMAQRYLCCTPHELVCVRFVPFCLSCDGDWFCFLSLDCHDCARIRMCGEQLMLSATMKIVRLSSYRRLCRSADENLFQEFVRKRKKTINNPRDLIRRLCQIYATVMRH